MTRKDVWIRRSGVWWRWLQIIVGCAVIILVSIASFYLSVKARKVTPPVGSLELTQVLLATASLALFVFSILIAIFAAFFGWKTIQGIVNEMVASSMHSKVNLLESELRGRVISVMGHLIGEMSINQNSLEPLDKERLREAVSHCQQGYEYLKRVGGPAEFVGLNNLIYYSCISEDGKRKDFLLEQARSMKKECEAHDLTEANENLLLTAYRAILQYSSSDDEKRRVRSVLREIAASSNSVRHRREAGIHLLRFPEPKEGVLR